MFCTGETVKTPLELVRVWLHETQRVYGDRLLEDKDLETLHKLQSDVIKKVFEVWLWYLVLRILSLYVYEFPISLHDISFSDHIIFIFTNV